MIIFGKQKEYEFLKAFGEKIDLSVISDMLSVAEKYALNGNLKRNIIAYLLASDENPLSLSLERLKSTQLQPSIFAFAQKDIEKLFELFFSPTETVFENYRCIGTAQSSEYETKREIIYALAQKLESSKSSRIFLNTLCGFYENYGVGEFGLNKGFEVDSDGKLKPVTGYSQVELSDIFGYERQKTQLCENTEAFLRGEGANNVLLYGESGTGKSSSIKAVANRYYKDGLRAIAVHRHQFSYLPSVIETIKDRNYKFIICLDDLSFESFEVDYKYLKAVIEGGISEVSANILFYATSNKRHLIKETFEEREGSGDLHRNETIAEKTSLSDRFGLQIYYPKPVQQEYFDIVFFLARQGDIEISDAELIEKSRKWAIQNGGFSGRAASQFITSLKMKTRDNAQN